MGEQLTKDQLLEHAREFVRLGRFDKAVGEYQKILTTDGKDQRVRLCLAELFVRLRQTDKAIKAYEEVADAYVNDGFYLKAVTVYKNLIRIKPAMHEANLALAELYEKMGLGKDAIHQYQILLRHFEQKGEREKALDLRRRIVALDPENVTNRIRLAESYQIHGEEQSSLQEYEILAEQLKDSGDEDRLIDLFEKILSRKPDHHDMLRRLCKIYEARQEWKKVLQWMTASAKIVSQDAELLQMQAEILGRQNQMESARTVWKELAELHVSRGNGAEALKAYEEILFIAPEVEHEMVEDVELIRSGALAEIRHQADVRRQTEAKAELEAEALEIARAQAVDRIQEEEEKAKKRAMRYAKQEKLAEGAAGKSLTPQEQEAARHQASACIKLAEAYAQMEMPEEARQEYIKALAAYRRLLAGGGGSKDVLAAIERLEHKVDGDMEALSTTDAS